jgi:hypothetical protein
MWIASFLNTKRPFIVLLAALGECSGALDRETHSPSDLFPSSAACNAPFIHQPVTCEMCFLGDQPPAGRP